MKIRCDYTGTQSTTIDVDDIADQLSGLLVVADADIEKAIRESVDEGISENAWPPYRVDRQDMSDAIKAVKKAMK